MHVLPYVLLISALLCCIVHLTCAKLLRLLTSQWSRNKDVGIDILGYYSSIHWVMCRSFRHKQPFHMRFLLLFRGRSSLLLICDQCTILLQHDLQREHTSRLTSALWLLFDALQVDTTLHQEPVHEAQCSLLQAD